MTYHEKRYIIVTVIKITVRDKGSEKLAKPNKVLIELRRKRGESQKTAAKNIGITQSMLAMLETGDRRGSDATKMAIANYYGVSVEHIFFGSNITKRDKEDK